MWKQSIGNKSTQMTDYIALLLWWSFVTSCFKLCGQYVWTFRTVFKQLVFMPLSALGYKVSFLFEWASLMQASPMNKFTIFSWDTKKMDDNIEWKIITLTCLKINTSIMELKNMFIDQLAQTLTMAIILDLIENCVNQ